jgi:peptidoglycan/LPS O-acetylase OafA/YrhL
MQHYRFIDTLRGLAAISVVLFHINETRDWPPNFYQTTVGYGWLGVPVFFVISGFVVQASARRSVSPAGFMSRRFWRIYPPFLASIGVVLAVVLVTKLVSGTNDVTVLPVSALDWVGALLLVTEPLTGRPDMNWVYWSLSYEVAFYLLLATTVTLPRLRWPILGLVTAAALGSVPIPVFFLDNWSQFALGVAIAEWVRRPGLAPAILGSACIADFFLNRQVDESIAALATGALILATTSSRFAWMNRENLISRVGTISYSLYLIHVPMGVYVFQRINPWPPGLGPTDFPYHLLCDAVVLGLCVCSAWWFWRFVEEPASRRFKSWRRPAPDENASPTTRHG